MLIRCYIICRLTIMGFVCHFIFVYCALCIFVTFTSRVAGPIVLLCHFFVLFLYLTGVFSVVQSCFHFQYLTGVFSVVQSSFDFQY